jgi:N-acetylmuramoyl-L-alanine amidase
MRHLQAQQSDQQSQQQPPPQQTPSQQNSPQQTPPPAEAPPLQAIPSQPPLQTPPLPSVRLGPIVVLDPGHGGTDTGSRGTSGAVEKDVVLQFARTLRAELERLGYRVVMTRNDDSNPSYDDRAAMANVYRDATFVSLHVSSTGQIGTARVYYYQFSNSGSLVPSSLASSSESSAATSTSTTTAPALAPRSSSLIPWEAEQRPFAESGHRLANLVQIELTHRLNGSPNAPAPVAVRSLRSVAAPAIAVEISSVSVSDPEELTSLAGPLASSVARGVVAFHPISPAVMGLP